MPQAAPLVRILDPNGQSSIPRLQQQLGDAPPLVPINIPGSLPDLGSGPAVQVNRTPTPIEQQIGNDQAQLQKIRTAQASPWGTAGNHPGTFGKIAHVLSVAGNIAGDIVAPNQMALIPGTQLNMQDRAAGLTRQLNEDQAEDSQEQARAEEAGNERLKLGMAANKSASEEPVAITPEQAQQIGHPELEGVRMPPKDFERLVQNKDTVAGRQGVTDATTLRDYAVKGLKPDGSPDEQSPIWQSQEAHTALLQAQAELAHSKNQPGSPAYQMEQAKLAVAQRNANAAQQRASAYMGSYMLRATGQLMNGQVAPGATLISDDQGNQTAVGTAFQSQAQKSQSAAAQFNDVHGALDNLTTAAEAMIAKGQSFNDPSLMYALQHAPHERELIGNYISSLNKSNLTPEQREYVTANLAAHENVQALRKSAGGTATDSSVAKLDAMIPGADTPDLDFFHRQLDQIRGTATRLGAGAPQVKGGITVPRQTHSATAQGAPKAGVVENGYRFKGGDPADKNSWEKVQ